MLNRFGLKLIFLLFLTPLCNTRGAAQVAFHNFNSNDGLPSNEIYSEYQDHDGFMWFATDHGIVKYNGYNFRTFTTADGLTDNTVLEIKGDDENRIWVLTLSGGMCFFDGKRFEPHPNNEAIKKLFVKQLPTSWQVLKNKQVWMGFVNAGFAKVSNDSVKIFDSQDPVPHGYGDVNVYVLHLPDGKFVYTSFLIRHMKKVLDKQVLSMKSYAVGFDFSGTNFNLLLLGATKILISKEEYLAVVDTNQSKQLFQRPRNNPVLKIVRADDGKIWMLQRNSPSYAIQISNSGLNLVDSMTFVGNTTGLLVDRQGNRWLTTLDLGIFMIPNPRVRIFTKLNVPHFRKPSCINSNSKKLFVGLPEGQFLEIDTAFNTSLHYAGIGVKWPTAITSITFKRDGEPQFNTDPAFSWNNGLNPNSTRILQIDSVDFLFGASNGLALLTKNKKVVFNSQKIDFAERVTELCKVSDTKYLVGTLHGLYNFKVGSSFSLVRDPFLGDARITAAKCLRADMFGIATRGKGVFINIANHYYKLGENDGLVSDLAEDLYFENDSVLWEASFKGISKIYFKLQGDSFITRIKNYTKDDGLCSNQVNGITGFNGFIWLSTNEGLCYFNPKDLTEETILLPLYFGGISVNGIKRPIDSLVLSHDENNIFIEFNALYYKAIQGIRYRVRLKGMGPWKYTDLNYVQYFSLPPGEYHLEVAADDKDGKYRSEINTLNFTIKPRFVDTAWFKLLVGLFILFIIAMVMYAVFSYQKLKSVNIIKLLQAEFKALSYQINPHFIFNVLNSIQYYILKKDTDNAVHLLGSFALLIRRIVNNSRQQYIGIIEEVECLRDYMDLEKMRLDNKFEYTINIDSSIDIEEKNILPMIIQPLVENSIWHGIVPSSKPGVISIDFKKENGAVICKVEDNGVGINISLNKEKTQNNLSLAMKNVSERLKIISELNESSWAIKTEDKSVTDPLQSGTIVTIVFPAVKDRK